MQILEVPINGFYVFEVYAQWKTRILIICK